MSVICQTFVQNAWRSDLCSNCFKCQDEHSTTQTRYATPQRYMPQALYQSRALSSSLIVRRLGEPIYERVARRDFASQTPPKPNNLEPEPHSRGILIKNSALEKNPLRSRPSVDFASEEALVIGYGGNDYDSDQSPWEMASDDESVDLDLLDDTDEDRTISRLTKNNTQFNASNLQNNNNNSNSNNNSKGTKQLTCVTYNDIQSEKVDNTTKSQPPKKLNTYYFSSNIEPLKSYLHNNNNNLINNSNTQQKPLTSDRVDNCLLPSDFSPLNTYSIVSELSGGGKLEQQHSSDSDYSTCRGLTPGDSTDSSESFQDAEDTTTDRAVMPCRSFLHGSFQPPSADKLLKYGGDGGSSTSGDVSNLSDDSDGGRPSFVKARRDKKGEDKKKPLEKQAVKRASSCDTILVPSNFPVKHENLRNSPESTVKYSTTDSIPDSRLKTESRPCKTPNLTLNLQHESAPTTPETKTSPPRTTKTNDTRTPRKQAPVKVSSVPNNEPVLETPQPTDKADKTQAKSISTEQTPTRRISTEQTPTKRISTEHTPTKRISTEQTPTKRISTDEIQFKTDQTQTKRTSTDLTHTDRMPAEKIYADKTITDKTTTEKIYADKTVTDRITTDKEVTDKIPTDKMPSDEDESSPEAINNRQSKLAALALELELARRETEVKTGKTLQSPAVPPPPPEVKAKCTPRGVVNGTPSNYPTIKKGSGISCTSRLFTLPDVIQESSSPSKLKKNRFSLKKLLKRNKDFAPPSSTPLNKETNPKAWKKQTFDRNRLSLEILHPMDLSPPTSGASTPSEEGRYVVSSHPGRGSNGRARSMSALPQLGDYQEPVLLECRQVDTLPNRKAGTVAERKKNRPSLVRTPSCSAIPNRPANAGQSQDRTPPPKPPPPPKCMHPPPPPSYQPRIHKPPSCSPARPPPPKIPETKSRIQSGDSTKTDSSNLDKEYANLGDIRSLLAPKKPERPSAVSASRDTSEGSCFDEEEDHYTYLDDADRKVSKSSSDKSVSSAEIGARPWVDIHTSYAAIAAANYEALAEIITSNLNESPDVFPEGGKGLKWKDFSLDEEEDSKITLPGDRCVYSATYKHKGTRFTLMVSPKHPTTGPHPGPLRHPVLATFHYSSDRSAYVLPHPCRLHPASQLAAGGGLRDACFVLLQLVHALKGLQADGVEEVAARAAERLLVAAAAEEGRPPVLLVLPEDRAWMSEAEERRTLCDATLEAMFHFLSIKSAEELQTCPLPSAVASTFACIARALQAEKASSLSQAKGLLEYMLWGPVDVPADALPRWLDLQRAQMLRSALPLLKNGAAGAAFEHYQLAFLVQATVKSLKAVMERLD